MRDVEREIAGRRPPGAIEVRTRLATRASGCPASCQGIAYIGHPHPLYGGTLDNKVVATIAAPRSPRPWAGSRCAFNFRGVGSSHGQAR
jgi:alpha/beta superfamily hydrolase